MAAGKKWMLGLVLAFAVSSGAAMAHGYGHYHRHSRVGIGFYMGVPLGYPWYMPPQPYYYYPPAVIVRPVEPQVYIERTAPQQQIQAAQPVWYYCNNPPGYYPYVRECPGGWQPVAPMPPPPN